MLLTRLDFLIWGPIPNTKFNCFSRHVKRLAQLLWYSPSNGTLFFANNIKSKMGIINLIRKINFNQKKL